MKVKCVKTSVSNPDRNIINGDMREYLKVGAEFWVYGLSFKGGTAYYYIFNDNHLFQVPMEMFDVIDGKVSATWVLRNRNQEVNLWPELFYREGFLENFAEREDAERNEFVPLRELIEC
jgi:hypothetical protein